MASYKSAQIKGISVVEVLETGPTQGKRRAQVPRARCLFHCWFWEKKEPGQFAGYRRQGNASSSQNDNKQSNQSRTLLRKLGEARRQEHFQPEAGGSSLNHKEAWTENNTLIHPGVDLGTPLSPMLHNEIDTKVYKATVCLGCRLQARPSPLQGRPELLSSYCPSSFSTLTNSRRFDRTKTALSCLQLTPGWHSKLCQQKQDFAACPTTKE